VRRDEKGIEQRGPRKRGGVLGQYQEGPSGESGEVMPEVKELKELALQVLQPKT
jgi:hypothetical protein